MEKRWSSTTKRTVVVSGIIALILFIIAIRAVLPPLVITFMLAYILSPIADFVTARFRLKRILAVAMIYLVLIAVLITVPALFIPPLIDQIQNFVEDLPDLVDDAGLFIQRPVVIGDFNLDLQDLYSQASSSIQGILTTVGTQSINILTNIASAVIWMFFILVASFYLVKDSAAITRWLDEATPPAIRDDARQLRSKVSASWNAFLRGQLILMIVMGLAVGTTMALVGLPHAWLIAILFGILEVIPNVGPLIASVPAVLIAYFEGSTVLNISNEWFALLVIGINFALQQLENNYLVPRVMGQSLNLHPVVVLMAAITGAHMAGILGILLAAPVVATIRILAEYVYRRLLDIPPFPQPERQAEPVTDPQTSGQEAAEMDAQPVHAIQSASTAESKQAE
jgi:predicted PurR-regulated permease PerM